MVKWEEITERESARIDMMLVELERPDIKFTDIGEATAFYRGQPVLKNKVVIDTAGVVDVRAYANSEVLTW